MRVLVALSLLALASFPSAIASAQTPPIVVVGPPPTGSGPPAQSAPAVPRGYEIEGQLGGLQFHAQITTPAPQAAPPVVAPPPVVVAPPAVVVPPPAASVPVMTGPILVVQQPTQPSYGTYAPAYAVPTYTVAPQLDRRPAPRLDEGMDFPARLALEVLGAGAGFGIATGLAYLVNESSRNDGFAPMVLGVTAGIVPLGVSVFGGSIAGGRGRYGGALLGELVGGGLSATILLAGNVQFHEPWEMIAAIAGPAILGAIIGFEAQHGLRTARLEDRMAHEGVQLSGVSVAPTAQGSGAMVGLSGTF